MTVKQINELSGKIVVSEILPGVLPPVYSSIVSANNNTVYIKNMVSGCISGTGKSHFCKMINNGTLKISNN